MATAATEAIGIVLVASALLKWIDPTSFQQFLRQSRLVRASGVELSPSLPRAIIVCEAVAGLVVTFLPTLTATRVLALVAALVFVGSLLFSGSASCGCFGALDNNVPRWVSLARAGVLLMVSAAVLASHSTTSASIGSFAVSFLLAGSFVLSFELIGLVIQMNRHVRGVR